ncbi:MAG: hypothetical protein JWM28_745 [Chitinophagaceae bacterium]|nr:hypothetical protein [Chitinophagaceae bacterium]
MSKPRHQHYIPKSYLKNFALEQDGKYFVEAKLKNETAPKERLISIRDICVDKNIYTLPEGAADDKYAIEKYYASEIDAVYPEIYQLLTDDSVTTISDDLRRKIILTTMSLFFRTPKFLNLNAQRINWMLDMSANRFIDTKGRVRVQLNGQQLDFHIDEIERARAQLHITNKLTFLQQHLKDLHEFVDFKMNAGPSVITVDGDIDLITSDNPVEMHSIFKNKFDPFDPTNIIQLPLDNRHYLIIYPNTEEVMKEMVFRSHRDFYFVLTSNHNVEKNSEDWILGRPGTIQAHLSDQKKHWEETPENLAKVSVFEALAKDAKEIATLIDTYGITHEITIRRIKEMLEHPLHENDTELKECYCELKQKGYII